MRGSVDEIQRSIEAFTDGLPELDQKQFDKVYALLKDLSLDASGNIKPTLGNLKIISRVKAQLAGIVDIPAYQDKVFELNNALSKVSELQTAYYAKTFTDFTVPKTIGKIQELAYSDTVDSLVGSGINEYVVRESASIVEQGIRDGANFRTLTDQLRVKMLGNDKIESRLISYAKQVITDNLSGFARNYHAIVTNDLGLEWYMYIGALVRSSRPMCIALVAKEFIHKSELAGIARGEVNGEPVSREGFMPNTTGENFIYRCAGYNCEHQCVPVPSSIVPQELRGKYETGY